MEEYIIYIYILCFYCCEVIEKNSLRVLTRWASSCLIEERTFLNLSSLFFFFSLSSESWQWMIFSVECEVDYSDY